MEKERIEELIEQKKYLHRFPILSEEFIQSLHVFLQNCEDKLTKCKELIDKEYQRIYERYDDY